MLSPNVQAVVALALLGLSLPALLHVASRIVARWRGQPEARWLVGAIVAAAALRWLVAPLRIATMYIGYLLTEQVIELQPESHYGVASQALYHALFAVLPHDHRSLMAVNAVVGVLVVPVVGTLAMQLFDDRRSGVITAWLFAVVPLFVRNDTSDANNVPWLLWFGTGLIALLADLESPAGIELLSATILLSLAAIARPEMPILVPVLVALAVVAFPSRRPRPEILRRPALWIAVVVFVVSLVPHMLHVREAAARLDEGSGLPGLHRGSLDAYVRVLLAKNTLLDPGLLPLGCLVAAVAGVAIGTAPTKTRIAVAAMSVISLLPYTLDLCRANMARVHVPAALWAIVLAGHGVASVWKRRGRSWAIALGAATVLSAVPTIRVLYAPTNEQEEESFIRESLAHLPSEPFTLVRIGYADRDLRSPNSGHTHRHFPDYLVRSPVREGRVTPIVDWMTDSDFDHPAFFYLGMRCYAEFRPEGTPPPHGDALQPACARMREQYVLEPVIERDVVNRGDVWLAYYGDAPRLHLGLYRIVRPR